MPVTAAFCPLSVQTLFDANACPIRGGAVYAFDAETTNPRTTFRDPALTSPHTYPVLTDAYGRVPVIYLGLGDYKIQVKDTIGAQVVVIDDLPGAVDTGTPVDPTAAVIGTGMIIGAHTDDLFDGWLRLNAQTIGDTTSGATSRANGDCQNLFITLWNKDPTLVVSGGRGASAAADWAASKTLTLPDYRGKGFCGVDGMGSALAGVITAATTPTPNQIGTIVGTEAVVLSTTQLPSFTPTVTIAAAGGHTHTGVTDSQGIHNHSYTDPGHLHAFAKAFSVGLGSGGGGGFSSYIADNTATAQIGITITSAGAHTHNLVVNAVADHTHIATAAPIGGGTSHPNMAPAVLGYWHIKL